MASPTDGQGRAEVPTAGKLFCMDRGLRTGPEVDDPAVGDELGRTPRRLGAAVESESRKYLRRLSSQLLLDGAPVRMGYRHNLPACGLFKAPDAIAGTTRHAQFHKLRCDALLREKGYPVGRHPIRLQWDPGNRFQATAGRRARQIPDERQLSEVLRQGLQRARKRVARSGNYHQ